MAEYIISKSEEDYLTTLNHDSMFVLKGGYADETRILEKSYMDVSAGASTGKTYVSSGGTMNVLKGGSADDVLLYNKGLLSVFKGGEVNWVGLNGVASAVIAKGAYVGYLGISAGVAALSGTVSSTILGKNGLLNIYGGMVSSATFYNSGSAFLYGGTIGSALFYDFTTLDVGKGGTVKEAVICGGSLTVSQGGKANDVLVKEDGRMYLEGGTAGSVTVQEDGRFYLSCGTVGSATILEDGVFDFFSGTVNDLSIDHGSGEAYFGTVKNLTLNGARMDIYSGTINNLALNDGSMELSSCKVNKAFVNGTFVAYGGTVSNIVMDENGYIDFYDGAQGNNIQLGYDAFVRAEGNVVLNNVKVASEGYFEIDEGSTVKGLSIDAGATCWIQSGCTATKVNWTPGNGYLYVKENTTVTFTSKYSGVYLGSDGAHDSRTKELFEQKIAGESSAYVMKGGSASGIELTDYGLMEVWNGGKATQTTCSNYGEMAVYEGGTAEGVTLGEDGGLYVYGGRANDVVVSSGAGMDICGGSASGVRIESGGSFRICSATVTDLDWTPFSGKVYLGEGAHVTFKNELTGIYVGNHTTLQNHTEGEIQNWSVEYNSNAMYVMSEGTATQTTVFTGEMDVFSSGSAVQTFINGGSMCLYDGAGAMDTYVYGGGLYVYGGMAEYTTVYEDGKMFVGEGGSALNVTLETSSMSVGKGGFAGNLLISSGACMYVTSGGSVNTAHVSGGTYRDGGLIHVSSGAVVSNITLEYGATLYVEKGAKALNVSSSYGATVISDKGATVKVAATLEAFSPDCDYDEKNGWEYKKKKTVNQLVLNSDVKELNGGLYVTNLKFDEKNQMTYDLYSNYVGYGDEIDFLKIDLDAPAILSFRVEATDAAKFTIWKYDGTKMVSLQSTALKEQDIFQAKGTKGIKADFISFVGTRYGAETKGILLEDGEYYLSMESTNAAKGGNAYYNVHLSNDCVYFGHGDPDDDDGNNLPDYYSVGMLYETTETEGLGGDWVGYDDKIDFRRFSLEKGAKLSFKVEATDAAKFTIWKYDAKKNKLVSVQSTALKKIATTTSSDKDGKKMYTEYSYSVTTAGTLLGHGTYYYSVESTNAAKGGNAIYEVYLNGEGSEFFSLGDYSDDWTDMADYGPGSMQYADTGVITGPTDLDANWVGFDDEFDYTTFSVSENAKMSFSVTADDAVKFTVFTLTEGKNGWKQNTLLSVTVKPKKTGSAQTVETKEYAFSGKLAGHYFYSVQSLNAKKAGPGANYQVSVNTFLPASVDIKDALVPLDGADACALAMPETSDSLGISDALSLGGYDADVLADASAVSLAGLNGQSDLLGLATLACSAK